MSRALAAAECADLAAAIDHDGWAVTPPIVPQLVLNRLIDEGDRALGFQGRVDLATAPWHRVAVWHHCAVRWCRPSGVRLTDWEHWASVFVSSSSELYSARSMSHAIEAVTSALLATSSWMSYFVVSEHARARLMPQFSPKHGRLPCSRS